MFSTFFEAKTTKIVDTINAPASINNLYTLNLVPRVKKAK
ncbi:hypothetical protein TUM1887_38660 [Escherichia coli]|nr:hypothetical protein TUM1887_38660 [Escherichia coli]